MNYRNDARASLKRAEQELASQENPRLKYAALELRMAMEAITYDRALAYKDEFPLSEYETWQPRKVMLVLLEIDPAADQNSVLFMGVEEEYGVPAPKMESLGAETVLNMETLKNHYDALGSYLHMQTIKQIHTKGSPDFTKIRSRCEEIASYIDTVLSSPVSNITLGNFATLDCECGKKIRKRIPHGKTEIYAECHECSASYTIIDKGENKVECQPQQHEVQCGNTKCQHKIIVWRREMELGRCWTCPKCGGQNVFALAIKHEPKDSFNIKKELNQKEAHNA